MRIERSIVEDMKAVLKQYPIIAVTGPRQSGKTTLLKRMLPDFRYVTLENPDMRAFATKDTKGFLEEYDDKVIFDEVQRVPAIFSYLQGIADEDEVMGQFVLSGSQNFELLEHITQSLAGRVALYKLFPFDLQELENAGQELVLDNLLTTGCYPAIYDRGISPDRYYADYLDTYVKRDISQLVNIQDMSAFQRFTKLCAARAGQQINFSNLARDTGVSHATARNWLSLLETSFVVFQLQPYYKNYSKRLTKSPKLYFYDTGLLCHLLGIRKGKLKPTDQVYGHVFENMIVAEYTKQISHQAVARDLYFWRDSQGHEVDLLYETDQKLHLVEIKSSSTVMPKMFAGLDYFHRLAGDEVSSKTLIYGGSEDQKWTDYAVTSWKNIRIER